MMFPLTILDGESMYREAVIHLDGIRVESIFDTGTGITEVRMQSGAIYCTKSTVSKVLKLIADSKYNGLIQAQAMHDKIRNEQWTQAWRDA